MAADPILVPLEDQLQRISAALYATETHPGHDFLRGSVSGATRDLWQDLHPEVDALWVRFGVVRDILTRATELRRSRPSRAELAELDQLLRDGCGEPVAGFADRLERDIGQALAILATVEAAVAAAADRVAVLETALGAVRAAAVEEPAEFERLDSVLAGYRAEALGDPIGAGGSAGDLARDIEALAGRLADLARLRAGYPARLATLRDAVAALGTAEESARRAYAAATAKILDPRLPAGDDRAAGLRDRVAALERDGRLEALPALETAVAAARSAAEAREGFAAGLLARRDELRGRLDAYRMKAVRTGRAEEPGLTTLYSEARTLLWAAPCDLPAATRAVRAYQQTLSGVEAV